MLTPLSWSPRTLTSILLYLLLASLTRQSSAVPLRSAEAVPDHWAQLLNADRYELVPRPSWTTSASHSHTNSSHFSSRATLRDHVPSSASKYAQLNLDLKPVSRTKIFKGKGNRSTFECHVHDPPQGIRIDAVIAKVISVCEESWTSSETVLMQLSFADLGAPETLANGGGTFFVKMKDTFDTVLPVAAAEAVRGRDLNGNRKGDGRFDVLVTVNLKTPWYDGIDANCPPEQYDLVTVILHEVYHNLLFAGSIMAEVEDNPQVQGGVLQTATLYKGYRTRFDSFLMNANKCSVLSYLTDQQLSSDTGLTTNQLLADAVCNDQLYWGFGDTNAAKLHSPRIFKRKSSIYHLDPNGSEPVDSLMFPTVTRGTAQHVVSERILFMQRVSLDPKIPGANIACPKPLTPPTPQQPIPQGQTNTDVFHGAITPNIVVAEEGSVGGFPTWGIVLLALFAFLLLAALLGLCLALCLRKGKLPSITSSLKSPFSSITLGDSTSTSSRGYGASSSRSSTSKTTLSTFGWSKSRPKKSSSKHTTKHSSVSTSTKPKTKDSSTHGKKTCPSSGKCVDKCYCMFCTPVAPPPPVASVHRYEPDCTPVVYKCKHKCRKHCSHKSSRKHSHTCEKATKKTCKSTTMVCCKCYCCKYEPSTCKSSSRCCKSSSKCSSSSSPKCTTSTSHKSSCKRVTPPSTKPPSTKPPSTKSPSTKSPTTKATSSKHTTAKSTSCKPTTMSSCRTCKKSCRTCKPSGNRCACRSCPMVEINIC